MCFFFSFYFYFLVHAFLVTLSIDVTLRGCRHDKPNCWSFYAFVLLVGKYQFALIRQCKLFFIFFLFIFNANSFDEFKSHMKRVSTNSFNLNLRHLQAVRVFFLKEKGGISLQEWKTMVVWLMMITHSIASRIYMTF